MANPIEKMIIQRLTEEVVKKIRSLDTKELIEMVRHFLIEHVGLLAKDADNNGKADLEEAMDCFHKGFALIFMAVKNK